MGRAFWAYAIALIVGTVLNITVIHDPELAGALLLSALIVAAISGATYERNTHR